MLKMSKEEHLNRVYKNKKNKVSYADNGGGKTARNNNNNQEPYNNNNSVCASKQRDNNNKIDDNHFTVERSKNKSATLNSGYRSLATEQLNETLDRKCLAETSCREYENVNFTDLHLLDKKLLLQKYFRSALVGPRSNVYENLCRGCNYGVFTARGPLCTFCECIVSGVPAVNELSYNSSTNIYENVCEQCNQIYSANEDHCNCLTAPKSINNFGNKSKHKSVEHLESLAIKQKVKVKKSKSFNKTDNKRKILSNFLDNWKRNKSADSVSSSKISSKKSLEIVHNVEGYDQVFHTQETFDLQRMCELKRNETSHSDQHIYGRLKQSDLIAKNSHTLPPQLVPTTQNTRTPLQKSLTSSTNSTTSSGDGSKSSNSIKSSSKRPRISKPRLLRLRSSSSSSQTEIQESQSEEKQSLYLPDSVCQWMTSLRREIYNYSTHGLINNDDSSDVYSLCYPKSIPAKNSLIYNQAPMTNYPNIKKLHELEFHNDEQYTEDDDNSGSESLDSVKNVLLRNHRNDISSLEFIQRSTPSDHHYQRMVHEFKLNLLINKEMHSSCNGSCKNVNTFGKNGNKVSLSSSSSSSSSSTGVDSLPIPFSPVVGSCLREPAASKRNNVYLKVNEGKHYCTKDTEKRADNNEERGSVLFKYRGMAYVHSEDYIAVSHPLPLQVDGSVCCNVARKRHGIHERNSEFVNDILTVFENLLQRDKQTQDHKILEENHLEISSSKEAHLNDTVNVGVAANNETKFDHTSISNTLQPYVAAKENIVANGTNTTLTQIFDLVHLINNLWLSLSLNIVTIYYDKPLKVFLQCIAQTKQKICNERRSYNQLVKKYQHFHSKYKLKQLRAKSSLPVHKCRSLNVELDFNEANGQFCGNATNNEPTAITAIEEINYNNNNNKANNIQDTFNDLNQESIYMKSIRLNSTSVSTSAPVTSVDVNKKLKIPPQVPKRDPKTHLCSNFKNKFEDTSLVATTTTTTTTTITTTTMTVPTNNSSSNTRNRTVEDDSIYQPIWKFKTVGDVPDMDYYEMNANATKDTNVVKLCQNTKDDDSSLIPEILISYNDHDHVEDHNEWETDDEFMFTTQLEEPNFSSSVSKGTIYSHHSSNSSSIGDPSLSGSTVTGFASSTATLASALSYSLSHHLFRSVGIFYSVTELKLRAIVYDYDRIQASLYFAKSEIPSNKSILYNTNNTNNDDSGIGKTPSPSMSQKNCTSSPMLPSSVSQVSQREIPSINSESACHDIIQQQSQQQLPQRYPKQQQQLKTETLYSLPDCVQAWKFQLLDVNYAEDEEDMVSALR
uniref:Uncharacterized protein n=1 Tax=Glossina pallidipes TaxID=7398 RepID=A0A1A9ZXE1_GLOPL